MQAPGDMSRDKGSFLTHLILYILAVKVVIFMVDPTVMFFIDDSTRYLDTAVSSYIPPDRSFLYGFMIRWLTHLCRSLTILVFFQVLCSAVTAVLAGYLLNRFLSVKKNISIAFAVVCAFAPVQVLYERYVMTETVSLMLFAVYVTAAFFYLRKPGVKTLLVMSLAGVFLIAFRLSYLPCVLCGAVIVPCIAFFNRSNEELRDNGWNQGSIKTFSIRRAGISFLYMVISCLLTYGLHSAYKTINGRLSSKPPAYQYCDGYHLLASWAPLLKKEDFADPRIAGYTQQYFYYRLEDRYERMNHRWADYGLIYYIHHMYDSRVKANKIAHDTAMNILRRDPLGVMRLAWESYMDYWDIGMLKNTLMGDRSTRSFPEGLMEILKSNYHMNGEGLASKKTFTNQYFLNAIPWYLIIFSLPVIIALSIIMDKGRHTIFLSLLGFFAILILINSTTLVHRNTMRFFHPDEWITVIFLGVLYDRIMARGLARAMYERLQISKRFITARYRKTMP